MGEAWLGSVLNLWSHLPKTDPSTTRISSLVLGCKISCLRDLTTLYAGRLVNALGKQTHRRIYPPTCIPFSNY